MPGEPVQLTDPKGRSHLITLRAGASFHTHRGTLSHDDIIGGPDGNVIRSLGGTSYVVFRPLLADFTLAMKRGAAVVYPKDAAQIVAFADVFPGARVLEAGAGSGALSCWLLRAVGEQGTLVSFERRPDFAEIARRNVEQFFGGAPPAWQLVNGEFSSEGRWPTSTGSSWTCSLPGTAWRRSPRFSRLAAWPAATSLPRRSSRAPWRPCAGTAASTSRRLGEPDPRLARGGPGGPAAAPHGGTYGVPGDRAAAGSRGGPPAPQAQARQRAHRKKIQGRSGGMGLSQGSGGWVPPGRSREKIIDRTGRRVTPIRPGLVSRARGVDANAL